MKFKKSTCMYFPKPSFKNPFLTITTSSLSKIDLNMKAIALKGCFFEFLIVQLAFIY